MTTYRRSAIGPVQAAVYQWLAADTTLTNLAKVYDYVPQGTKPPYIEISELIETPNNTEGQQGREILVTIFAWSKQPGFKELEAILDSLLRLLDEDTIPVSSPSQGWTLDWNQVIRDEVLRLPDGITRQLGIQVQVLAVRDLPGE